MSRTTRILLIVAAVLLAGAGVYGYFRIQQLKSPVRDPLEAVPVDAFCVIGSHDARETWEKLSGGNLAWAALGETGWASKASSIAAHIDSLLAADAEIAAFFDDRESWLSLHCTGKDDFDYLVAAALPGTGDMDEFSVFVKKHAGGKKVEQKTWKQNIILTVGDPATGRFFTGMREGVILLSENEALLKSALEQLEKGPTLKQDKSFAAVRQTAGEKAVANIYFNYPRLVTGLKRLANDGSHERLESIAHFAGWTEMDLALRPNAVLMNGYTAVPDSAKQYLGIFSGQQPQRVEVASVLPGSTITYTCYGISNFQLFNQRYDTHLEQEGLADERRDLLAQLKRNYGYDPDKQIGSWLGNEIAVATLPAPEGGTVTVALLSTARTAEAKESLIGMEDRSDTTRTEPVTDSTGYVIRKSPVPGMLPATFGELFGDLREAWYTVVQHYLVFAPDENTLRAFIAANENRTTLANNRAYADFSTNISEEASITIYASPGHSLNLLKAHAGGSFAGDLQAHAGLLRRFDGAVLQYSAGDNDLYYTNIFLRHNPQTKRDISTLWETQLDTTFSGKPWLVNDHKTKGMDIFVQDDANKIYLISSTGAILWKKQLPEKIMGDVQQVDALKNGKLQLIFNTASSIYIVDRNGNDLAPFPLRLPAPATNTLRVMDYENSRDYRLLIACADKKVYNYTIKGAKVGGWKIPVTEDVVVVPVQHTAVGGKDYVIVADRGGKTYITDRQGNMRLNLKERLTAPVTQVFVEPGKDLSRTRIVSADSLGNVSRLSLNDELERMHFMDFGESPGFEYRDINSDGSREFIFLDAHRLMIFNQDKAPVMSYTFDSPAEPKPMIFLFDSKDVRIGALCRSASEVHLINNGGMETEGFPLQGTTPFSIGRLNGSGELTLLCGNNGRYLCAWPLR